MKEIKIDLRPHYTFAFCTESMEFGGKHLLYFSRKDHSLHILFEAPKYGIDSEEENAELSIPLDTAAAKALETVFALFVTAFKLYEKMNNSAWRVCDGSFCTVICGRNRVHYEGPRFDELFESFDNMANSLLSMKAECSQAEIQESLNSANEVKAILEEYIENNR